jgi:predicted amidohydrolase YtcJ
VTLLLLVVSCRDGSPRVVVEPMEPAELVLVGGPIYTMDGERPRAEALAVRGERIAAVGSRAEIERLVGPKTRVIDLKGRAALPGLIDAHIHFPRLGPAARTLFLDEAKGPAEVVAIVRDKLRGAAPGTWLVGRGWHTVAWSPPEYPADAALSEASPENPVYLAGMANHAAWVNRRAMELAGITRDTADPPDGRIVRGPDGEPTGILLEGATQLVARHLPAASHEQHLADVRASIDTALRLGFTEVHDAGTSPEDLAVYEELAARGELRLRVYALLYVRGQGPELDAILAHPPRIGLGGGRLTVRAIKAYADGALGARGAVLLAPYADAPAEKGQWDNDPEALYQLVRRTSAGGWQIGIHAIGDGGNRAVLDAVERVTKELGPGDRRPRIEHAQILAPADIPRLGKLGVIASMQPIHATMDMGFAEARLGKERLRGAYAWRSLIDSGAKVVASADTPAYPVEYSDPLRGLHAAVTRQDGDGQPAGGWTPDERVTMEQAVAMYTRDAAYAAFEERDKGTLTAGKLADVTILSADPFTVAPALLLKAHVDVTIVSGRVEYER